MKYVVEYFPKGDQKFVLSPQHKLSGIASPTDVRCQYFEQLQYQRKIVQTIQRDEEPTKN